MAAKNISLQAQKAFMAGFIDFEALGRICEKIPAVRLVNNGNGKNAKIYIPSDLYHKMHEFYGRAQALADAMNSVFEDGEHQLVYEEARSLGIQMPDLDAIRADVEDYKKLLNSFNAYAAVPYKQNYVRMDEKTVQGFRETMIRSRDILKELWLGCFDTEYIDYFTVLKQKGVPYAGQSALQQMMNIATGFITVDKANDKYLQQRTIRKHWPEFAKS